MKREDIKPIAIIMLIVGGFAAAVHHADNKEIDEQRYYELGEYKKANPSLDYSHALLDGEISLSEYHELKEEYQQWEKNQKRKALKKYKESLE